MEKIRPSVDEFCELEVSFDDRNKSAWGVVSQFAKDNTVESLCAFGGVIVSGVACVQVGYPWACCVIIAVVLAFSVFIVVNGKEKDYADELGDEPASTRKTREDQ